MTGQKKSNLKISATDVTLHLQHRHGDVRLRGEEMRPAPFRAPWPESPGEPDYKLLSLFRHSCEIREKTVEAAPFKILKIKLGTNYDFDIMKTIRDFTDKPLRVDANLEDSGRSGQQSVD